MTMAATAPASASDPNRLARGLVHVLVALLFVAMFVLLFPGPSQAAVAPALPLAVP